MERIFASYLVCFERVADLLKVGESSYAVRLGSLLIELRLLVKERLPKPTEGAVQLADTWASAHNTYSKPYFSIFYGKKSTKASSPLSKSPSSSTTTSSSTTLSSPLVVCCHNCGEQGHILPQCPKNPRAFKGGTSLPHKSLQPLFVTPHKFTSLQSSCASLTDIKGKAASAVMDKARKSSTFQFVSSDGLFYHK
ncbi:hypothetical protein E2C01_031824 [Portunus trituberculatus]|uniref:CCHC-type domain-containing protein n=1 Tax=Portunus trituberculatus TaxID=210409 RepID=A0A5B7EZ76_PORTR|nr:hypothetical protein [Portunus trituberculatus]